MKRKIRSTGSFNNDPWFFRHINKIITGIFIFVFVGIICQMALIGYATMNVQEKGLKGVVESVWCGSSQTSEECKESIRKTLQEGLSK
ncbi:hypothetical protein HPMBJEAJ_00097 [Aeromonas phage avDM6]|nr:hypothetical protein HPMBJEAJ_00097 [Aeromonas phage avDM6]